MMDNDIVLNAKRYKAKFQNALLKDVLPFWEKHSPDWEHGGYFSCLMKDGAVYDTDKFSWPQARELWLFSKMYNKVQQNPNWLKIAKLGADFLKKYAADNDGYWYFSLTQEGKPIIDSYNYFSDCFGAIAFAQYAKASGDKWFKDESIRLFEQINDRKTNPKRHFSKAYPGTRLFDTLALYMIDVNVALEMNDAFPEIDVEARVTDSVEKVLNDFVNPDTGLLHEVISPNKKDMDTHEGRVNIPGHGIECAWFIMEAGIKYKQTKWIDSAIDIILKTLDFGWDKKHGGLLYFIDMMGKPTQQLEWDQKLWWAHNETEIALAMGFLLTGRKELADWFEKVHNYTWNHFPDPEFGEWTGYLNRQGEPLLELKGGKWKGCFHLPRALWMCSELFDKIDKKYN